MYITLCVKGLILAYVIMIILTEGLLCAGSGGVRSEFLRGIKWDGRQVSCSIGTFILVNGDK